MILAAAIGQDGGGGVAGDGAGDGAVDEPDPGGGQGAGEDRDPARDPRLAGQVERRVPRWRGRRCWRSRVSAIRARVVAGWVWRAMASSGTAYSRRAGVPSPPGVVIGSRLAGGFAVQGGPVRGQVHLGDLAGAARVEGLLGGGEGLGGVQLVGGGCRAGGPCPILRPNMCSNQGLMHRRTHSGLSHGPFRSAPAPVGVRGFPAPVRRLHRADWSFCSPGFEAQALGAFAPQPPGGAGRLRSSTTGSGTPSPAASAWAPGNRVAAGARPPVA